jgi:hypothetical protein
MAEAELQPYALVAFNTATASSNRIHDDSVAQQLGFRGGLVPGVDVYAYLTHPPAAAWGRPWLERGTMRARFLQPVYDGERTDIRPTGAGALEARGPTGAVCATAHAGLPAERPAIALDDWPDVDQSTDPPPAAPEVLVPGTAFGLAPHGFHAERAVDYLVDVREDLPLYRDDRIAHPGWVLRDANYVLSANVRLGPWIHVESIVQHHGVVEDGDEVSARALVTAEWERKGHRFVTLDVLHLAGARPVARTEHTAIYRPRGT